MESLLFDYGGTLDADGTTWADRFYPLYKEAGIDVPLERFERAFYDSEDALAKRHRLSGLDLEATCRLQVRDTLAVLAPDRMDLVEPLAHRFASDSRAQFKRLKPVLERLSKRFKLGVVSNFYGNLDDILTAEGLRPLFTAVADSGVLGITKPEAKIFLHALEGRSPSTCVMVGDSIKRDMAGAHALGMKKALVSAAKEPPKANQDWTIRSVVELEACLS